MSDMKQLRRQLQAFAFGEAFTDTLQWNHTPRPSFPLDIRGRHFDLTPIADAGGFVAVEVTEPEPPPPGPPARGGEEVRPGLTQPGSQGLRRAIASAVTPLIRAHLLIFVNAERTDSIWQCSPLPGTLRLPAPRRYGRTTPTAPLVALLKNLEIPFALLDDEGEVAHPVMDELVRRSGILADKVTKTFYKDFSKRRDAFEPFLAWVADEQKRAWYVTAVLNRLMFIYFIQEKGLLPGGTAYLAQNLAKMPPGENRFYPDFFIPLCFLGFGKPKGERGPYEEQFADVPYLDGGLFAPHEVELRNDITLEAVKERKLPAGALIPDAQFRQWFEFLGSWRWPLDEEDPKNDGEINPGILGYIFEQYINQKQMGAYYTKEDITGYICRNTILPRLFDMLAATAGKQGQRAVDPLPIGPHPNLLNDGGGISLGEGIDRYVYPAVKTPAYLPTETDREYEARQKRYQSILQEFEEEKIRTVNDFITDNLDIERMAADFVASIQDPALLRALYRECVQRITVLDPTCGSGAFLFAALRILYPIYDGCLTRMEALLQAPPIPPHAGGARKRDDADDEAREALADFEKELAALAKHPRAYYIHKSIIVNNLFGVDIMEEAVEICKLRLFLKLIAHAEVDPEKPNWGIEPLPDIDFNVLAGNTLVGYTQPADIDRLRAELSLLPYKTDLGRVYEGCVTYGLMLGYYRDQQLGKPVPREVTKAQIQDFAATHLRPMLDVALRDLYEEGRLVPEGTEPKRFRETHHPFHWFVEFPTVMKDGGFDVVVGNPPYVEYTRKDPKTRRSIKDDYCVAGYVTESCGNLFAFTTERCGLLLSQHSRFGMIVPMSIVSTQRMSPAVALLSQRMRCVHVSNYSGDAHPSVLFNGVKMRLSVVLGARTATMDTAEIFSTAFLRWYPDERGHLFERLAYAPVPHALQSGGLVPKVGMTTGLQVLQKLAAQTDRLERYLVAEGPHSVYAHRIVAHFVKCFDFMPYFRNDRDGEKKSEDYKVFSFQGAQQSLVGCAVLNSSTFYYFYLMYSDAYHCGRELIGAFPCALAGMDEGTKTELVRLNGTLMQDYRKNSVRRRIRYHGTGWIEYDEFYPRLSKPIIDEIDRVLAEHYGFTEEELDFILHYDIKYRMGGAGDEE